MCLQENIADRCGCGDSKKPIPKGKVACQLTNRVYHFVHVACFQSFSGYNYTYAWKQSEINATNHLLTILHYSKIPQTFTILSLRTGEQVMCMYEMSQAYDQGQLSCDCQQPCV